MKLYDVYYQDPVAREVHGKQPNDEPWWCFGKEVAAESHDDAARSVAVEHDLQGQFRTYEVDASQETPVSKSIVWEVG